MSKFSVKKPYTVLVAVIMVIVLGIVSFTRMSADLLPSINLPYVIVMTTYVGASPETVETVVTKPVESAMATISNIENISSVSNENYSMVIMEFEQSTNMDSASLEIRESLDQIKSYWDDSVGNPIIMKLNPDMLPIMVAAVGVEGMSDTEVSEYTEEKVVPRLESIEGVASASAVGLIEESVHVVIRQEKIDAINEQVFGSIDKDLDEAQQEINDGRADLADGEKEIADNLQKIAENEQDLIDAKKEIEDGKAEITDKEGELEEGKEDLEEKKKEATEKIAEGVKELNSKKRMLDETVKKVEEQLDAMGGIPVDDAITGTNIQITNLENVGEINETTYNPIATSLSITIPSSCTTDAEKVQYVQNAVSEMLQQAKLALKGLETYKNKDSLYAQIDSGMAELTKGQIEAAAGFGSADATIAFGETQLESAKKQLESSEDQLTSGQEQIDSAKEQIDSAKEQLADAREQLADAQKQLDDSRDMAYSNADMNGILTVETVKSLLTAQNFSMPAGYVTEDGTEYLIRVGDKPDDVEKLKAMPLLNMNMDGVDIITLDDVADVFLTDNSADIYTNVNGAPGVLLQMQKQTGYSTGDVSDKILAEFNEMTEENENLILITLMDQGIYIDLVMDSIINNILFGAVLAILILRLLLLYLSQSVW